MRAKIGFSENLTETDMSNIENQSMNELEQKYEAAMEGQRAIERRMRETKDEIERLSSVFEEDCALLKDSQQLCNILKERIFVKRKEGFKEMISADGLKKIVGEYGLFGKVADKTRGIIGMVDGTASAMRKFEEKYEEYRQACFKAGEQVKSREEFRKMADSFKNLEEAAVEEVVSFAETAQQKAASAAAFLDKKFDLTGLKEVAGKEFGAIKSGVMAMFENLAQPAAGEVAEVRQEKTKTERPSKDEVFGNWAEAEFSRTGREPNFRDLDGEYSKYRKYVSDKYGMDSLDELSYSKESGDFVSAIRERHPLRGDFGKATTKAEAFAEWAKAKIDYFGCDPHSSDKGELYADYKNFMKAFYREKADELSYSDKGGAFTTALNKRYGSSKEAPTHKNKP